MMTAQTTVQKFGLLTDLGIIVVPKNYEHRTALAEFARKHREKFYYFNNDLTDEKFPNPTRILNPGDKFRVQAFQQIVDSSTTSEERMSFLAAQQAVLVGAQGLALVFDQKRDQLPTGNLLLLGSLAVPNF